MEGRESERETVRKREWREDSGRDRDTKERGRWSVKGRCRGRDRRGGRG